MIANEYFVENCLYCNGKKKDCDYKINDYCAYFEAYKNDLAKMRILAENPKAKVCLTFGDLDNIETIFFVISATQQP
jgi:hypothetical protein